MEWKKLLDTGRLGDDTYAEQPERPIFVQDMDRIAFSAPFRRLANKTQVHPLYDHDHLHHRLIHSMETTSAGRSLGMLVGHWLEVNSEIIQGQKHEVANAVQAACLAHDIGNPPFGHSGEAAIGDWFERRFDQQQGVFGRLGEELRSEFVRFEGNAQGFRILSALEMYRSHGGMRLSHAVLGAFSKYPVTAASMDKISASGLQYCGVKKFGIFHGELDLFRQVADNTGLIHEVHGGAQMWRRHPLVFLVEAADDICYNIVDLEDAFTSEDLSYEAVVEALESLAGRPNREKIDYTRFEWIAYLRARGIGAAINACFEAFKDNYDDIMSGEFSNSLIGASSKSDEFSQIKALSRDRLFTSARKTELEVSGRNAIHNVLDGLEPVLTELCNQGWDAGRLSPYYRQLIRAVPIDLRNIKDVYTGMHALTDFVSGMTDRYTLKISRLLSGF